LQVLPNGWTEHQARATSDFVPPNVILSWYVGSLNFRVDLFPDVRRPHYLVLARIVKSAYADHGIPHCV